MIVRAPAKPWPHVAAILTGGRSSRMGVPKPGMLLPDGRSMAERMRDTLAPICREVVFLGDPHGVKGHDRIDDRRPDAGPLAAIESLLESDRAPEYLVVPCDLPLLPAAMLIRLFEGDERGLTCFELESAGEDDLRPLPCRVSAACLPTVESLLDAGRRSIRELVHRLGDDATRIALAERESELLLNVNTPEDFERACRRLGGSEGSH